MAHIGHVTHGLLRNWNFLSVQDPFVTVPAADEKSDCQQKYKDGITVTKPLVCSAVLPGGFVSVRSGSVWRDLLVYWKELGKLFALLISWCK